jgi:hypothetical protein
MGDDDRAGQQLPHRAREAAEAKTARTASPSLSAEMRQRMQAAIESERARATEHDQKPAGSAREAIAPRPARQGGSAPPTSQNQPFPPVPLVTPEPGAYPLPAAVAPVTGRPPARKTEGRRRGALTGAIAAALILVAAGSLGVAVARYITGWAADAGSQTPALTPAQKYWDQMAATWVYGQVSHTAAVSCDPAMCKALTARGFPSGEVRVLGPTSLPPVTSAVVIVTQAVLDLFGTSLSSEYAPASLATFGSGDATVTVRVMSHGAAIYLSQMAADLKERITVGTDLTHIQKITMSPEAERQLLEGAPDSRLLLAIAYLAAKEPIDILDFGNVPPVTDNTIPLRYADLAESDQAAQLTGSAYVRALRVGLDSSGSVPNRFQTATAEGQAALRVEFTAPSVLGLLGPQSSP